MEQLTGRTEALASDFVAKMLPIFAMTPVAGLRLAVPVGLARKGFRSDGSPDPRKDRGDPAVPDPAWSRRWLGEPVDGE